MRTPLLPSALTALVAVALVACNDGGPDTSTDGEDTSADTPTSSMRFSDPLTAPEEPHFSPDDFNSAETCARCHPTHYEEWKTSPHAYAMKDPVFRALTDMRQEDFSGQQDKFCTQCHSAVGVRGGAIQDNFSWDELDPIVLEGITCESCHKITSIERPFNGGHVLDPTAAIQGPIADPVSNSFHDSEYNPIHEQSEICGSCHDVIETNGLNLERPYEEWTESPAEQDGRPCQDCHMPSYTGQAATDAPERELHSHRWVGVGLPLLDGFIDDASVEEDLRTRRDEMLDGVVSVHLDTPPSMLAGSTLDLVVTLKNEIDGHYFPTGSDFNRQCWLEVTAHDADGNLLYETGLLDEQGDLRNFYSELDPYGDQDLILLSAGLLDFERNPTWFTWDAEERVQGSLGPLHERTYTLFVPSLPETSGPVTIEARLLFRAFPPYLLRNLGLDEHVDKLEITEIDAATIEVDVTP